MRKTSAVVGLVVFLGTALLVSVPVCSSRCDAEADASDAVLLYDPGLARLSDKMFDALCQYFGLKCRKVDVTTANITDSTFVDEHGRPIGMAAVSALVLCGHSESLDSLEVALLSRLIESGALKLLVTDVLASPQMSSFVNLARLTQNEITGVQAPICSSKNYSVTSTRPDVTKELTGQSFAYEAPEVDVGVSLAAECPHVSILVTSNDASGNAFPLLVAYQNGGSVFVSSGVEYRDPASSQLVTLMNDRYFSGVVPLCIFIRYSGGDECWHRDFDLANFTIDDPALTASSGSFPFSGLLEQMTVHHFHTTIAFEPKNYVSVDPGVAALFKANSGYLSLVQHGNNHDDYEFYRYSVQPGDRFPARPLEDQEVDIVEGMYRMQELERLTGIHSGRIMIFPLGSSPMETYKVLKKHNFLATVNASETGFTLPLDAEAPSHFTFDMYPACLEYANFTSMFRWLPSASFSRVPMALFLDKPLLVYEHLAAFSSSVSAFNDYADRVNVLNANVIWTSLQSVCEHAWLEKNADDGSVDVMLMGRRSIVNNPDATARTFRVSKLEDRQVPIHSVTVNGTEHAYVMDESGHLSLEVQIQSGDSAVVEIDYGYGDVDFAIYRNDLTTQLVLGDDSVSAAVHNLGTEGGGVTVQFYHRSQGSEGLLRYVTTAWVLPGSTLVVSSPWKWDRADECFNVELDPYNVTLESRENNNEVSLCLGEVLSCPVMLGNSPNPFRSRTDILFDIPLPPGTTVDSASPPLLPCTVMVMDVQGRVAVRLFEGALPPGTHMFQWAGADADGTPLPSGVYLCVLETEGHRDVSKAVLVR